MKFNNTVGFSNATYDKQDGLAAILKQHMRIVKIILGKYQRYPKTYHYIETNAGDGKPGNKCDGSPVIFLNAAKQFGMNYEAHFMECNHRTAERLRRNIETFENCYIHIGDNQAYLSPILRSLPENSYGLIYCDPNYMDPAHFLLLENASTICGKLDILFRYSATDAKRNGTNLIDCLKRIRKNYWIVRRTVTWDTRQWTFLMGSNFGLQAWVEKGFYRTDVETGRKIIERLTLTHKQLEEKVQPTLFQIPSCREEVIKRSGGV